MVFQLKTPVVCGVADDDIGSLLTLQVPYGVYVRASVAVSQRRAGRDIPAGLPGQPQEDHQLTALGENDARPYRRRTYLVSDA